MADETLRDMKRAISIILFTQQHNNFTISDVVEICNIPDRTSRRYIKALVEMEVIKEIKSTRHSLGCTGRLPALYKTI